MLSHRHAGRAEAGTGQAILLKLRHSWVIRGWCIASSVPRALTISKLSNTHDKNRTSRGNFCVAAGHQCGRKTAGSRGRCDTARQDTAQHDTAQRDAART